MNCREYIHSHPNIAVGKPVVKGTRLAVEFLLDLYGAGWTETQILESYPHLTPEALRAVHAYAAESVRAARRVRMEPALEVPVPSDTMTKPTLITTASTAFACIVLVHVVLIHRPPIYFWHRSDSGVGSHTDITCDWGFRAGPLDTDGYRHYSGRPVPVMHLGYEVVVGPLRIDDYWR